MPDDSNPFRLSGVSGAVGASLAARANLQNKLTELQALGKTNKSGNLPPGGGENVQKSDIEKAATQFEALLLHQMLKEMWNTVPKDGLLSGGHEEELYRDMLNEGIANEIAEKQSIGVRDVLIKDMQRAIKK